MKINVTIPDNWSFRYWGNRKGNLNKPELHQSSFEELPSENSPHKILFTSISRFEKGASILGGTFEMVALYRPNGLNLESEIEIDSSEISRSYGKYIVAGNSSTYLHLEKQGEGYIRYMRCYYWFFQPNIWLACVASGSSLAQFNEALSILEHINL